MTDKMDEKIRELCPGYASIRRLLLKLNYDYLSIIDHWESRIGETVPLADLFGGNPVLTIEDAAEAAYLELVKTAKELYFSRLTRDAALTVANALASGTLKLAEDLEFNGCTFAAAWSAVHPDEEKIRRNTGFEI